MGHSNTAKTEAAAKKNIRNVQGTFAAEGIKLGETTRRNLERIAGGEVSYQQVLLELKMKYEKRG